PRGWLSHDGGWCPSFAPLPLLLPVRARQARRLVSHHTPRGIVKTIGCGGCPPADRRRLPTGTRGWHELSQCGTEWFCRGGRGFADVAAAGAGAAGDPRWGGGGGRAGR